MAWTREQETLFLLIQKALFNKEIQIPDGIDWETVFRETEAQRLSPLLYAALPDTVPAAVRAEWETVSLTHAAHTMALLYEQGELTQLLEREKLSYVILKGCAAAVYYPEPDCRTMGDIDVLVSPADFDRSMELLSAEGFERTENEKENSRHIAYERNDIKLELHRRFSYDTLDFEQYLLDAMPCAEQAEIDGCPFAMLPRLANGLVILTHIWDHLNSMIGLRQILDWMMYVNACMDAAFWEEEFRPVVRELGLEKLALTLTLLGQRFFGLEQDFAVATAEDDSLCERLLQKILEDGNFGEKRKGSVQAETVGVRIRQKGLLKYLQSAGLSHWEAAQKHAVLRPFAWGYQILRMMKMWLPKRRSPLRLAAELNRAKGDADLLKELGIRR